MNKGEKVTILGIDPGTRNCGYCVLLKEKNTLKLIEAGFIKIKEKILQHQILELVEGLDVIFKNHVIDEVAIEDIFYAYNPQTVLKLAHLEGLLA